MRRVGGLRGERDHRRDVRTARARRARRVHLRAPARRRVRVRPPPARAGRRGRSPARCPARRADDRRGARSLARRYREHGPGASAGVRHVRRNTHQPHLDHGARARDPVRCRRLRCAAADPHRRHARRRRSDRPGVRTPLGASHPRLPAALRAAPRLRTAPALGAPRALRHRRRRRAGAQGERGAPGGGYPRGRSRRAGHWPLPHRVPLHRSHDPTRRGRAVRGVPRDRRGGEPATGHAAHVRHRRRQVREHVLVALGDEPRARPAGGPARAQAARGVPHPAARDGPRQRARRRAHHDPDGHQRARDARGTPARRAGVGAGAGAPNRSRSTFRWA